MRAAVCLCESSELSAQKSSKMLFGLKFFFLSFVRD